MLGFSLSSFRFSLVGIVLLGSWVYSEPKVFANDTPQGYHYGADSAGPGPSGSSAPYSEPTVGGYYGSYVGEVGTWTDSLRCTSGVSLNISAARGAEDNHVDYGTDTGGIGYGFYYFMGGPGADPDYNGTTAEANAWGEKQGQEVIAGLDGAVSNSVGLEPSQKIIWMDVEGTSNGWQDVSYGCGRATSAAIPAAVDAATLGGFDTAIGEAESYGSAYNYVGGVYSAPDEWSYVFGTSSVGDQPGLWEWTYEADSPSVAYSSGGSPGGGPGGWCIDNCVIQQNGLAGTRLLVP